MLSVEEALERILAWIPTLPPERKPVLEALDQVLAEDVVAGIDLPQVTNSALDGYAVRAADTVGASRDRPRVLQVIGEVPAGGAGVTTVGPGQAVRIMTGGPVPAGADAVVPFELTNEAARAGKVKPGVLPATVEIHAPVRVGQALRQAGEDIRRGQIVLTAGRLIRPAEIAVLTALGYRDVAVYRRPLVAILATGDEIVEIGEPLGPHQVYNSNAYALAAAVRRAGGIPHMLGIARDTREEIRAKVGQALTCDLLLTSGGVSKGDKDFVRDILAEQGEVMLWSVNMRPGKPLAFGLLRRGDDPTAGLLPQLGLPGNPVSSMVTFELFARPAIRRMLGATDLHLPSIEATLAADVHNEDGRRFYVRAWIERCDGAYLARPTGPQGSHMLTSMSAANGLVVIPEGMYLVPAGASVRALLLDCPC